MINFEAVRKAVAKGLKTYLGAPVIRSNQAGKPPAYPYLSYTITTLMSENNGTWGEYEDGAARKPFTQVWSVTAQSDDYDEAVSLAAKAREWLDYAGRAELENAGIIVQSVTGIANRDNLITIEYEYRQGFDATLWLMSELESNTERGGVIEDLTVNDIEVHRTTQ